MSTMKLTFDEKAWIKAYRKALRERFPGMVERLRKAQLPRSEVEP